MLRPEIFFPLLAAVGLWGCQQQQLPSTTSGKVRVECDESVFPVLKLLKEDFERTYKDASVDIRSAEARSAIADFIDDSVRVIVCARSFNAEERAVIKAAGIEYQEYKIALDAVAVIGHRDNALKQLRVGQLDSIFSGSVTRWPGKPKSTIEIAVGGANTSINEVFRNVILKGRPFSPSAIPFP
ncbi:MAG: substrate-binding domain-containing protein, partial [Ignavibacteriae bacterium]|nr:substrate-binding domain-containing protein [Ignavibacteriota bacterium]